MFERHTSRHISGLKTTAKRAAAGALLLLWGLQALPVRAISVSPDAAEAAMNLVSYTADCTGENLSANRALCRETLTGMAGEETAWEVAEEVADNSLGRLGKMSGKLGKGGLGSAAGKVLRAVGPAGKLADAYGFGSTVGTAISDRVVSPRMEAHYREQERREREKIQEQTDLLRSDRFVAAEYRELLRERGAKEANAWLDEQTRIVREYGADSTDSYYEEMEDDPGGRDRDRPLTEPDPDIGASCNSPDIYPVDDPCDHVRRDFEYWTDNITSPAYLETFSCQKMWGDMYGHFDEFEACYRREYPEGSLLYRCSLEFLDTVRQMIDGVTRASGCEP